MEGGGEEGAAEGEAAAEGEEDAAPAPAARLECFSIVEAFLSTYPHLQPLLGSEPTNAILKSLIKEYKHEQRQDAALMASVPLFAAPTKLTGPGSSASGPASRSGRLSKGGSRGSMRKTSLSRGQSAGGLSAVPEDAEALQRSGSSARGSARGSSDAGSGGKGQGLTEQMMLDRQQSGAGSSIAGSQAGPRAPSQASGGESRAIERAEGRSLQSGTQSISNTINSSAGTALSDASHGQPPFVDQISKVQRLQRSRLHGRFQREARVQRRWEELKTMAMTMQQQQHLAGKAK